MKFLKMKPVVCHNTYHIGDGMIIAHLLRHLAKKQPDRKFWLFLQKSSLPSISEVVQDLQNIELFSFDSAQWAQEKHRSVDTWKNYKDNWVKSKNRWNWVEHTLEHHDWTAKRMGCVSDFTRAEHLLFDYPALGPSVQDDQKEKWDAEFLICNSDPRSGQVVAMQGEHSGYLDDLVWKLGQKYSVTTTKPANGALCTQAMGHSISMIGRYSIRCKHHILVSTGPSWPTFNTHNHHLWDHTRKRIVLLDNGEHLNLPWIQQVGRVEEAEEILRADNLL